MQSGWLIRLVQRVFDSNIQQPLHVVAEKTSQISYNEYKIQIFNWTMAPKKNHKLQ